MIFTYFLFFSFLSTSNKAKKNPLERKSSHFPYFLAPPKKPKWPKNEARETNLLPCGQTALATVWNVRSGHGIHQNLRETYTLLMVPCWVRYDNYRGRYRHFSECHRLAIAPCIGAFQAKNRGLHEGARAQCRTLFLPVFIFIGQI